MEQRTAWSLFLTGVTSPNSSRLCAVPNFKTARNLKWQGGEIGRRVTLGNTFDSEGNKVFVQVRVLPLPIGTVAQ